ncbi:hypothetical protein WJX77_007528 [Trebouxia sp. C0004]
MMHSIVNRSGSSLSQGAGKGQEGAQKGSNGPDCAVSSASSSACAGVGGGAPSQADARSDGAAVANTAGADSQAAVAVSQQAPVDDYYRLWFAWSDAPKADTTSLGTAERAVPESTAGADTADATRLPASVGVDITDGVEPAVPIGRNSPDAFKQQQEQQLSVAGAKKQQLPIEDYYRLWFSWNSASAET